MSFILIIVIIVLISIIIGYKIEFKRISNKIDDNLNQYINVRTKSIDRDVEKLVDKINIIFDEKQKVVAESKKKEEELRQSITNMAHDLRTPLTSILGYLQMIKENNISEEERELYLDIIYKRANSLQKLVSSFYELSRIKGNEYKFNFKSIDLSNILCENIALFYEDFITKGVEPIIDIDHKVTRLICDEGAVYRIFSNLISNMIKHGEDDISIVLREENNHIITKFINKSSKITEENVDKIFDRFYTPDESRSYNNTGLGLYITKVLVEKLGHKISGEVINNTLAITIEWTL